jgi:hypothetical protein
MTYPQVKEETVEVSFAAAACSSASEGYMFGQFQEDSGYTIV